MKYKHASYNEVKEICFEFHSIPFNLLKIKKTVKFVFSLLIFLSIKVSAAFWHSWCENGIINGYYGELGKP